MIDALLIMLKNVAVFVLLAVPGVVLIKTKLLKAEHSAVLSKLLLYVGMPFLILNSTLNVSFNEELLKLVLISAAIGLGYTLLCVWLSKPAASMEKNTKTQGMMRFCMVFANNGFIGIPLATAVLEEGSNAMAYLIILNIITNVTMFTLGVYLISGDKSAINVKKAVLNPVLIAFVAGIILNVAGVGKAVPELQTYSTHLKGIVTPLSMVILGMKLAGVKFSRLFSSWRMYYVSAVRLVVFGILGVAVAYGLHLIPVLSLTEDTVVGFFFAFAMPTAGLAAAFADQYKGDSDNAVIFTLGTTVLSVATIPVLYWLLRLFVG